MYILAKCVTKLTNMAKVYKKIAENGHKSHFFFKSDFDKKVPKKYEKIQKLPQLNQNLPQTVSMLPCICSCLTVYLVLLNSWGQGENITR